MVLFGGVLVFWLLYPRKEKIGLKSDDEFWLLVNITLFSGPVSGRILWVFEYTRPFSMDFWRALVSRSTDFSMFGAFIGMPLAFWAFCRWYKIPFARFFDGVCLMACVWHIFGRLGCFLAGCCHGRPTTLPWGITFTNPASLVPAQWLGVPLHPTQLLEAAGDAVIAVFLYRAFKREAGSGLVAAIYLGSYGVLRFLVEFLRGDTVPLSLGLTAGQFLSLGLITAAGAILVCRARAQRALRAA
jgi:phosphatidylglycerol:prolipoprotein diacylglycerol transferase